MELFKYQKEAVEFMEKSKKTYLALDLGMGKTISALEFVKNNSVKNILLIAEKNEIVNSQNFRKEVEAYFPELRYINLREEELPKDSEERCVCGINPDGLKKLPVKDIIANFDTMVMDEATLAKTTTTARFKAVHKVAKAMDYIALLSGTPMMNGASEIYSPLVLLDHPMVAGKGAKGRQAFEKVFAGGYFRKTGKNTGRYYLDYAWWAKGANNVRELRYLLRDHFFFMNKSETDIFKTKHRKIERVEMTLPWTAEYNQAWENYLVGAKKRKVNLDNVKELRCLIENGQCYQVNSKWKAKRVIKDIASGVYGNKERIVIFSMFIETDKLIQEGLMAEGISFRTFEESEKWKTGKERVLVGRIKAHGKGANLPEASICIFVDMDFVPTNNIQAENRIDRPQQTKDMNIIYYLTEGDDIVDSHVRDINKDKTRKIEKFMMPLTEEEIKEMPERFDALRIKYKKEMKLLEI